MTLLLIIINVKYFTLTQKSASPWKRGYKRVTRAHSKPSPSRAARRPLSGWRASCVRAPWASGPPAPGASPSSRPPDNRSARRWWCWWARRSRRTLVARSCPDSDCCERCEGSRRRGKCPGRASCTSARCWADWWECQPCCDWVSWKTTAAGLGRGQSPWCGYLLRGLRLWQPRWRARRDVRAPRRFRLVVSTVPGRALPWMAATSRSSPSRSSTPITGGLSWSSWRAWWTSRRCRGWRSDRWRSLRWNEWRVAPVQWNRAYVYVQKHLDFYFKIQNDIHFPKK